MIVVEMLDSALVFRLRSRLAKEDRVATGGGEPSRCPLGFGRGWEDGETPSHELKERLVGWS